jgi:long-chain acyl-CoA synthetase
VAVAGVPDSYRGEIVKAFVVLRSGEQATVEEIREFAKGRLAGYKVPRSVEFRDDLPKTLIGKVLRRALVEEEQARQTAESGAETAVRPAEQGPRTQAESRAESP